MYFLFYFNNLYHVEVVGGLPLEVCLASTHGLPCQASIAWSLEFYGLKPSSPHLDILSGCPVTRCLDIVDINRTTIKHQQSQYQNY